MRVIGPVGTELEFHGDAGGHPSGSLMRTACPRITCLVDRLAGHHVDGFHDHQQEAHSSVNGTNRKWYSAVTANCRRDSRSGFHSLGGAPWRGGGQQGAGDFHAVGLHRIAEINSLMVRSGPASPREPRSVHGRVGVARVASCLLRVWEGMSLIEQRRATCRLIYNV